MVSVVLGLFFPLLGCSDEDEPMPARAALLPPDVLVEGSPAAGAGSEQAGAPAPPALQPALPVLANQDHELLLSSEVPELAANKRLVYDMWRTLIEARDTAAAEAYFAEGYLQHNPNADTGRAGVLAYFSSLGAPLPVAARVQTPLVAIVAERDYVALVQVDEHAQPRPYTTTWFDLFRIEEGRIAEHWDHGRLPAGGAPRAYVPPVASTDPEASLASTDPELAANKRFVYDMWRTLLDAQQVEEAPKFLAEGYIQHNPQANTGLQGFLSFFRQFAQPREVQPAVANFIQEIAEGDLVVLATVRSYDGAGGSPYTTTWFDMFRRGGGLLVEHWDTATLPE
ncbi:MAG TPA: nuclear transport factor 2 family protein [Polyangiaceae bacterium]|nr:nuclear transport factor 2 family protein [Polyangiaceae bacterium]